MRHRPERSDGRIQDDMYDGHTNRSSKQQPFPDVSVVGCRAQSYEDEGHEHKTDYRGRITRHYASPMRLEDEPKTVRNKNDRIDTLGPIKPRKHASPRNEAG